MKNTYFSLVIWDACPSGHRNSCRPAHIHLTYPRCPPPWRLLILGSLSNNVRACWGINPSVIQNMGACGLSVYYSCRWVWVSNGYSPWRGCPKGCSREGLLRGTEPWGKRGQQWRTFPSPLPVQSVCSSDSHKALCLQFQAGTCRSRGGLWGSLIDRIYSLAKNMRGGGGKRVRVTPDSGGAEGGHSMT